MGKKDLIVARYGGGRLLMAHHISWRMSAFDWLADMIAPNGDGLGSGRLMSAFSASLYLNQQWLHAGRKDFVEQGRQARGYRHPIFAMKVPIVVTSRTCRYSGHDHRCGEK